MRIKINNLGVLVDSEILLSPLTVVCGGNNSGKTYAAYALYGFICFWHDGYDLEIDDELITQLQNEGSISIPMSAAKELTHNQIKQAVLAYKNTIPSVFASNPKLLKNAVFDLEVDIDELTISPNFKGAVKIKDDEFSSFTISEDGNSLIIVMNRHMPFIDIIRSWISNMLKVLFTFSILPRVFIASSERTGVAIFKTELDFARSRLIKKLISNSDEDPMTIINQSFSDYPQPINDDVEYARTLATVQNKQSFLDMNGSTAVSLIDAITKGTYAANNGLLSYQPLGSIVKLSMHECSSGARSLMDLWFYLHHSARVGDLLIIDEPEMNLHIGNQRLMARLLACIVNSGIRVFITTHSDTLVRELSMLVMLWHRQPYSQAYADKHGIPQDCLVKVDSLSIYMSEPHNTRKQKYRFRKTTISTNTGADIASFDNELRDMLVSLQDITYGVAGEVNVEL